MPVHEAWVLGALSMLIGLILGNLAGQWWAQSHPDEDLLDAEFDAGYEKAARDAWMWAEPEDVPRSDDSDGRIAEESGLATMPGAQAGPGHTTYSELTALADRDELEAVSQSLPAVDPDWHEAFLARSEAWLADCRAELGLVAA